MFRVEDLLYLPKGIGKIEKNKQLRFVIWGVMSFIFFMLVNFPSVFKSAFPIYLLGMLPIMIAFSDTNYINSHLKHQFKSLRCAVYKGNIIWILIYMLSLFFSIEDKSEIFIRACVVLVFWFLSIILVVTFKKMEWIVTFICIVCISCIFLFWMRSVFSQGNISYILPIAFVVLIIVASSIIIDRRIKHM